jgi:hypothetical protein
MFHYLISSKIVKPGSNDDESMLFKLKHSCNTHQSFILIYLELEMSLVTIHDCQLSSSFDRGLLQHLWQPAKTVVSGSKVYYHRTNNRNLKYQFKNLH